MQLLDGSQYRNNIFSFIETDTELLYNKNLKRQPEDWCWRDCSVQYTMNSQGYRTKEWDQINWSNSILLFGGSDILGVGVDDKQTLSYYLQQETGLECVNLGSAASSPQFHWINTVRLKAAGVTPKAVFYHWTDPQRSMEFLDDNNSNFKWGPWVDQKGLGREWSVHYHQGTQWLIHMAQSCEFMWNCKVIQREPIFVEMDWPWNVERLEFIDVARDVNRNGLGHFGPKTYESWAKTLVKELKL